MSFLYSRLVDVNNPNSLAQKFRNRRFAFLKSLLDTLPRPLRILDIGGTQAFWNMVEDVGDTHVTLLNLKTQEVTSPKFESVAGDATALDYEDKCYDVVFSNSVIEHLFTWENQMKMAGEVQRVGKNYFIQTPNYYFPIEPHWVFPCFHYLPKSVRVMMTRRFSLGHIGKISDREKAQNIVREIQLLTIRNMKQLFPTGKIWQERIGPLTKSMVAYEFGNGKKLMP